MLQIPCLKSDHRSYLRDLNLVHSTDQPVNLNLLQFEAQYHCIVIFLRDISHDIIFS